MRELRGLIPRQSQDPLAAPAVPQHTAGCAAPSWPAQLPMKPPIRYHLIAGVFCAYYEKKKKKRATLKSYSVVLCRLSEGNSRFQNAG